MLLLVLQTRLVKNPIRGTPNAFNQLDLPIRKIQKDTLLVGFFSNRGK